MQQFQTIAPLMGTYFPSPFVPFVTPLPVPQQQQILSDNDIINIETGTTTGNPSPVTVTDVTTPTYTALATDYFLCVDTATSAVTITLPIGILGTVYIIKDCSGNANTNSITINGTGQTVDGSTATINAPYGSIQLIFNGNEWSIV